MELCPLKEKTYPKGFFKQLIQTFQRHKALNPKTPEHRTLFMPWFEIFMLLKNNNKQIQYNVIEWVGKLLELPLRLLPVL